MIDVGGEAPPNIFRHIGTMVHYFHYVFPASSPNIWTEAEAEPEAEAEAEEEPEAEAEAEAEEEVEKEPEAEAEEEADDRG
jgi:hypothetical protein